MNRVRVALVLVALALWAPLGLLVTRALESEAAERAAREGAVADRAFDEMERALSDFLAREDARPAGHYRFFMTPEGAAPGVLVRSPLAAPPADPFVLGYFQIDSDGSVHSPLRPRPDEVARAGAETPPAAALEAAQRVEQLVGAALASLGAKERDTSARNVAPPAPAPEPIASKDEKAKSGGVYDALQQLNRGAEVRAQRSRKLAAPEEEAVAVAPPPPEPSSSPTPDAARAPAADLAQPSASAERQLAAAPKLAPRPAAGRAQAEAPPPAAAPSGPAASGATRDAFSESVERKLDAEFPRDEDALREAKKSEPAPEPGTRSEGLAGALAKRSDLAPAPPAASPPQPAAPPARPALRIAVDPLIGRSLDAEHLLLQRTVLIGERGLRQGLVLDVPKLGEWLRAQSVGDGRLPGAGAAFAARFDDAGARDGQGRTLHAHRFAEPFDALAVQLALPPLEGGRRFGTIAALAALVVLATCVGLVAVERMVSLAVGFAERRSNFVAAVSHELKTPLTTIRMYGEMLRDGMVPTDAKKSEYYRTITAEAERLSRLIGNVLEFARLEKGTREMALTVGPLGPVVLELAGFLRPHVEAEGFTLDVEAQPDLPPVRFERDALLQVLFNLVDNAVKYARGAQERRVVVACRAAEDGGVELAVRDFGPGVPSGHLRRVFEPFHRAESELTRTTQGTGLGLALVRGLAERMGARVAGANAPGGGFEVRLCFAGGASGRAAG